MKLPKIVGMYMIKNEEKWIKKSIESILEICSEIVIVDDGSTDDTVNICKSFDQVNLHHHDDLPFDEPRDRNNLLKMALEKHPDFVLSMDGDEILMKGAAEILFEDVTVLFPDSNIFELQNLEIWNKKEQYRYDGLTSNTWRRKLMRLKNQPADLVFSRTVFPNSLHTPPLPQNAIGWDDPVRSRVKILHFGNYTEKIRRKKYEYYTKMDPNNIVFDGYKHLISDKGRLSGSTGIKIRKIPSELIIDVD